MLLGEYTHAIDDKNRVSLPAKFRSILGKKIVITPGLDNCLFLFTEKEWQKVSTKLSENSSLLSSDMRSFTRFMYGGAVEVEVDRIDQIPEVLAAGVDTILLDNMTPAQAREAVDFIAGRAATEVSGGVKLETVRAYAEAGINVVSAGALTHSTPALDVGLDFEIDPNAD